MREITLDAGTHSFYGRATVTVLTGRPVFHGAAFSVGASFDLFAPGYRLPCACDSDSAFSLRAASLPPDSLAPDELRYYFPQSIPEGFNELIPGFFHSPIIRGPVYPAATQRFLDSVISKHPSRILITGGKGAGKSLFSRYALNRVLNVYDSVAFLDLDPGQPELSLSGSLSLSLLTDFLLNPPEHTSHLSQRLSYPGLISIPENLDYYYECVKFLIAQIPSDTFLIVNSFGWVKDLGLVIHRQLIELLECETIFFLHKVDESAPDFNRRIFRSEIITRAGPYSISARDHRELRIYSYFRRGLDSICCQQPIAVSLSEVRIGVLGIDIDPSEILTAICGSIVALCRDDRQFPPARRRVSLLKSVPPMPCVGFALVKAIDKDKGVIYLLTPIPVEEFNTILRGAVFLPASVLSDTFRSDANFLAIGVLDRPGASTDPLVLKKTQP
jgi:polynucleotide 5'-hydroxyl-kinase GRC3/NOL9